MPTIHNIPAESLRCGDEIIAGGIAFRVGSATVRGQTVTVVTGGIPSTYQRAERVTVRRVELSDEAIAHLDRTYIEDEHAHV